MEKKTETTTAIALKWDEAVARQIIFEGNSVSKPMAALAPKGALAKLRNERKVSLQGNSSTIMGKLADDGFVLSKLGSVATRKDGRQVVNLTMETKPVRVISEQEMAEALGVDIVAFRAACAAMPKPKTIPAKVVTA